PTAATQGASQSNCEYAGDSGWAPIATVKQRMYDWLDTVEAATGQKAIIYSYVSWFTDVGITDTKLADYPLYIASYPANPATGCAKIPAPWTTAVFWQYSATTQVPGITTPGDVDRFFGTEDQLKAITIQASPPMVDAGVVGGDAGPTEPPTGGGCGCRGGGS